MKPYVFVALLSIFCLGMLYLAATEPIVTGIMFTAAFFLLRRLILELNEIIGD